MNEFNLEAFKKEISDVMNKHGVTWITATKEPDHSDWYGNSEVAVIEIWYKDEKSPFSEQVTLDSFSGICEEQ